MSDLDRPPSLDDILSLTKELGVVFSKAKAQLMVDFLVCLKKWNHAYNLTAIRDYQKMLSHHVADSLSIAPFLTGEVVLDVGTGAGFPGIPLAIAYPDKTFTLLDSVGKKIRFLYEVVRVLGLTNVQLVNDRVERFRTEVLFDTIVARAVSDASELVELSSHLLSSRGQLLLQKGVFPQAELVKLGRKYRVEQIVVPSLEGQRHVIIVEGVGNG